MSTFFTEVSNTTSVPVAVARGVGGRNRDQPLYEATIGSVIYVICELGDGRVACAPAGTQHHPPSRPTLDPALRETGGHCPLALQRPLIIASRRIVAEVHRSDYKDLG